jgi:hypothetical protein
MKEESQNKNSKSLVIYFKTLLEHRDIIEKLLRNNITYFLGSFTDKHEKIIISSFKDIFSQDENVYFQYAVQFQLGGLARIMRFWFQSGCYLSPEEMNIITEDFFRSFKRKKQSIMDLLLMINE